MRKIKLTKLCNIDGIYYQKDTVLSIDDSICSQLLLNNACELLEKDNIISQVIQQVSLEDDSKKFLKDVNQQNEKNAEEEEEQEKDSSSSSSSSEDFKTFLVNSKVLDDNTIDLLVSKFTTKDVFLKSKSEVSKILPKQVYKKLFKEALNG
jgi:hypothetical protein